MSGRWSRFSCGASTVPLAVGESSDVAMPVGVAGSIGAPVVVAVGVLVAVDVGVCVAACVGELVGVGAPGESNS